MKKFPIILLAIIALSCSDRSVIYKFRADDTSWYSPVADRVSGGVLNGTIESTGKPLTVEIGELEAKIIHDGKEINLYRQKYGDIKANDQVLPKTIQFDEIMNGNWDVLVIEYWNETVRYEVDIIKLPGLQNSKPFYTVGFTSSKSSDRIYGECESFETI